MGATVSTRIQAIDDLHASIRRAKGLSVEREHGHVLDLVGALADLSNRIAVAEAALSHPLFLLRHAKAVHRRLSTLIQAPTAPPAPVAEEVAS